MSFLTLFLSGSRGALASILLKIASQMGTATANGLQAPFLPAAVLFQGGALVSYGAGFALYAIALRNVKLSIAFPVMVGVTLLEILIFSLFIGESLSVRTMLGAGLLLAAIFLLHA